MNKGIFLALADLVLAGAAGVGYHLYHRGASSGPAYHVRTEFEFMVHAPYSAAAPLFGPEGEKAWASDSWHPHFVYPQPARYRGRGIPGQSRPSSQHVGEHGIRSGAGAYSVRLYDSRDDGHVDRSPPIEA